MGFSEMDMEIARIAENIISIHREAYEIYLPLVENICIKEVSEYELEHILDGLLSFACDEKMLELFKKVCRRYFYLYPACIVSYIEEYREMWGDKSEQAE